MGECIRPPLVATRCVKRVITGSDNRATAFAEATRLRLPLAAPTPSKAAGMMEKTGGSAFAPQRLCRVPRRPIVRAVELELHRFVSERIKRDGRSDRAIIHPRVNSKAALI